MKDYYSVLGVAKSATPDEIKSAYRNLAREWHPDRHPENAKVAAEEKFKEIGEAYDILGDPQKRSEYDNPRVNHPFNFDFARNNWDISQSKSPRDITAGFEIDLVDVVTGASRTVQIEHDVPCSTCDGTGSATKKSATCPHCKGAGRQTFTRDFFMMSQTCMNCRGSGKVPESSCPECSGHGEVMKTEKVQINIPIGVNHGQILRVKGMGRHGGDLKLFAVVKDHPKFERVANDLYCSIDIPFMTALKGGKTTTTGITGEPVQLEVPRGIEYGGKVVAAGKGILNGCLNVFVRYKIPCLSDEAIKKISEIIPD